MKVFLTRLTRFVVREWRKKWMSLRDRIKAVFYRGRPLYAVPLDRPVKVVFLLEYASAWGSFESVWKAFGKDPGCEACIVCVTGSKHSEKVRSSPRELLIRERIPFFVHEQYDLAKHRPDVVFLHLPYEWHRPSGWKFQDIRRHIARIAYISYGFEIAGGRSKTQYNMPVQQQAWRVFVHSDRARKLYAKHCITGDGHVAVTGHPMTDFLHAMAPGNVDQGMKAACKGRRTVLWCPHHGEYKDQHDLSTFLRWKDSVLALFESSPNLFLILRPHPLLYDRLVLNGLMSKGEVQTLRDQIKATKNVWLDEHPDFRHAFALSHGLMCDGTSFLLLYPSTGKPVMYLPNPKGPGLNEDGAVVESYYIGATFEHIKDFIEMVGRCEDPRKDERMRVYSGYITLPKEGAGEAIKRHVMLAVRRGD